MYICNQLSQYIHRTIVVNFGQKTYIGILTGVTKTTISMIDVESSYINDTRIYSYSKINGTIIIDISSIKNAYNYNNMFIKEQII